jgi:hypothetical protein
MNTIMQRVISSNDSNVPRLVDESFGIQASSNRNVLSLGMSYLDVQEDLSFHDFTDMQAFGEMLYNKMRSGGVTEMDANDLIRLHSMEANFDVQVYAVSLATSGPFRADRHLNFDFNNRHFVDKHGT